MEASNDIHSWRTDRASGGDIHVSPNFGRNHRMVGLNCWCHPEDPDADLSQPIVVIHNVAH